MKIQLATQRQGILILSSEDSYLGALKNWEYRAKTGGAAKAIDTFRTFLAKQVLSWNQEDKERLHKIIESLNHKLGKLSSDIVKKDGLRDIFIIKTTGLDEWKSAYTRDKAIVLPVDKLENYGDRALESLLAHEVFHVLSRYRGTLREKLYKLLGYDQVSLDWGKYEISERILVNPDALDTRWALIDKDSHDEKWILPIIFLKDGRLDFQAQDISERIAFQLYVINVQTGVGSLQEIEAVESFRNRFSAYGFMAHHPEEILAEAFVSFLFGENKHPFMDAGWYEQFCLALSKG